MAKATFAAGCFWGVEAAFRKVPGVESTTVGYTGGSVENPSYEEVCSGQTSHAEAVEVEFDPARVSYDDLLQVFWDTHDPTTPNRQGADIGSQYRSAIFFEGPEQEAAAEASKKSLDEAHRFAEPIVTEMTSVGEFYPAETYHQQYYDKRGLVR